MVRAPWSLKGAQKLSYGVRLYDRRVYLVLDLVARGSPRGPRGKLTLMCYVQTKAVETQMSMTRMDLAPIATRSLHPLDSEVSTRPKCCGELPHAMESSPFLQDLVHE